MRSSHFVFDNKISRIFDSMAQKSIPGYRIQQEYITTVLRTICRDGDIVLDLGASTGTTAYSLVRKLIKAKSSIGLEYHVCDASRYMIERAQKKLTRFDHSTRFSKRKRSIRQKASALLPSIDFRFHCMDIANKKECYNLYKSISKQSCIAILLIYTLQFIAPEKRRAIIEQCWRILKPGGVLCLAEKLVPQSPLAQVICRERQYRFKRGNGYSHKDIMQKDAALVDVLISETDSFYTRIWSSLEGAHCTILYSNGYFRLYLVEKITAHESTQNIYNNRMSHTAPTIIGDEY